MGLFTVFDILRNNITLFYLQMYIKIGYYFARNGDSI